jgi:hypothetical protein
LLGLALAMAAPVGAAQPEDVAATDDSGARALLAGLALTPPALYPEKLPRPFRSALVLANGPRTFNDATVDYLVQWLERGERRPSALGLVRLGCADITRGLGRIRPGEFGVRRTTVRHAHGTWVADDMGTALYWCEGDIGYAATFAGPTEDWRLERRKVRALVRALVPVTP